MRQNFDAVRVEKERLKELANLSDTERTKLRKAILHGLSDYAAAELAGVSEHAARTMRARLKGLDLVPPVPAPKRPKKIPTDPRQLGLLPDDA